MTNLIMAAFGFLMLAFAVLGVCMFTMPVSQGDMAIATALSRKGPLIGASFREAMEDGKVTEMDLNQIRHVAEKSGEIYK